MWGSKISPRPLTAESLKIIEQKQLAKKQRGNEEPVGRTKKPNFGTNHPEVCLRTGTQLPKHMRLFFTPDMMNIPLEDFDPFYAETKTFVVITRNKVLHRFSANLTLNLFSPFNSIRRTCISLLHNTIYRWFMIFLAILDCTLLAQSRDAIHASIIDLFGVIYAFDFVINVIARGLILGQFTVLRDGWGWIDLGLLVPYFLSASGGYHVFSGFRALKIASLVPSLKSAVEAVLRTVRDMRDIFVWTFFTTWIFALGGRQLFMGVSSQKCVRDFPEDGTEGIIRDMKWRAWVSNSTNWRYYHAESILCGNYSSFTECPENYTCLQGHENDDLLYGSIGRALMSTSRLIQQDSWEHIYQDTLKTAGPWAVIYFVVTIFLGSFYTLNMLLAVVSKSYDELKKERQFAEKLQKWRCSEMSLNVTSSETNFDNAALNNLHPQNQEGSLLFRCINVYCKNPIKTILKYIGILLSIVAFDPFTELIMAVALVANLILLSVEHFGIEENPELRAVLICVFKAESGESIILVVIVWLLNSLSIVYHHDHDGQEGDIFYGVYDYFTSDKLILSFMFTLECLLKFVASGPISYFKNRWNIFDFILLVVFMIDLLFEDSSSIRLLGCIRSFRVFKLARIWPLLNTLMESVFSSMGNVSDMTLVAIGTFYMFCVAGIHLFRGDDAHNSKPSWHFGDFWHSFMVIFRLLCGEWTETMWECVDANGPICIPFFITAVIVLNLIVLNLLLVMFLQRFSTASLIKNGTGKNVEPNQIDIVVNRFRRFWNWIKRTFSKLRCRQPRNIEENEANYCQEEAPNTENADLDIKEEEEANEILCGRFKFRPRLLALMHSKFFKIFNIGITILSAISLSLNDVHLKTRPWLQDILLYVEYLIFIALCLEAFVKVSAVGFSSYIKISWNRLDFIILLSSVINVISSYMETGHIAFLKSIRVFRLTSNFEGMRKLLNSLGKAMGKIFGVLLICLLIWLVCAIIGVQLLNGTLYKCVHPDDGELVDARLIKSKWECLANNFTWKNSESHFDNVGSAYYCILQVITFKGWTDILYDATNARGIYQQHSFENQFWISGYFVVVILGGSFFAFNLFIGVLIDGVNEETRKTNSNFEYKHGKARIYTDTREIFLQKLNKLHIGYEKGKFQNCMVTVVTSRAFEMVVLMNILLNMVSLTMERQSPSQRHKNILLVLNGISTGFLSAECLLKLFATDYHFFKGAWNLFDIVVTTVSITDLIWQEQYAKPLLPFSTGFLRLVRLGKVSYLLRQFKAAAGLRQLMSVLQVSLPAFFNMCILLFLVMFIYGTLGMEFFKDIKLRGVFDPVFNFQTLPQALIVLFQIVTAAGWNRLFDTLAMENDCELPDPETEIPGNCGNPTIAGIFVISYLFITFVILVNMFSAVILEKFSQVMEKVECELDEWVFDMFIEVWSEFDQHGLQFVDYNLLSDLFESFEPPLRVPKPNRIAIAFMNIPIYEDNKIHSDDVLAAAIKYFYFRKGIIDFKSVVDQEESNSGKDGESHIVSNTLIRQRESHCAKVIQRAWRNYRN